MKSYFLIAISTLGWFVMTGNLQFCRHGFNTAQTDL